MPEYARGLSVLFLAAVAGAAHADTYPMGALAFFNAQSCPTGWAAAAGAGGKSLNGFFLVPFTSPPVTAAQIGTTVGQALASGENRTHVHPFSSSIDLTDMSYAGVKGCQKWLDLCDKQTSASGTQSFSGTTGARSSDVPYVQLLLCAKTAFQRNVNPPAGVPPYVVTFFSSLGCPTGWKPTMTTGGYFIVGLPTGGTPAATFGGLPLAPGEDRAHAHAFSGSVTVNSAGVELSSGGQADNYGKAGTYSFAGTTNAASTGLPYVVVQQCQACASGDTDPACAGTNQ